MKIKNLMDMQSIEGGNFVPNLTSFNVGQMAEGVFEVMKGQAASKNVALQLDVGARNDLLWVRSDQGRIE